MKETANTRQVTAMMRLTKISFTRIIPAHILASINSSHHVALSNQPILKMSVHVSESDGSPYAVTFRLGGYDLAHYTHPAIGSNGLKPWFPLSVEGIAYLSHAADEAFAIVAPIALSH